MLLCGMLTSSMIWGQTPAFRDIVGHDFGERFTRHHLVVEYIEAMADANPHWQLTQYGTTSEGRPLLGLVMSSPSNMKRLDMLKADNALRVNEGVDRGDRVVWVYLSYNVHGNEAVCTEAAMATAEALATTHSHLLERVVVVMEVRVPSAFQCNGPLVGGLGKAQPACLDDLPIVADPPKP